jgi:hypothetical protein
MNMQEIVDKLEEFECAFFENYDYEPKEEDYYDWVKTLDQPLADNCLILGFEKLKVSKSLLRHCAEKHNILTNYMHHHLNDDEFLLWQALNNKLFQGMQNYC